MKEPVNIIIHEHDALSFTFSVNKKWYYAFISALNKEVQISTYNPVIKDTVSYVDDISFPFLGGISNLENDKYSAWQIIKDYFNERTN